eukprot:6189401-Pleurochrysis_carterae.AAC.3
MALCIGHETQCYLPYYVLMCADSCQLSAYASTADSTYISSYDSVQTATACLKVEQFQKKSKIDT